MDFGTGKCIGFIMKSVKTETEEGQEQPNK